MYSEDCVHKCENYIKMKQVNIIKINSLQLTGLCCIVYIINKSLYTCTLSCTELSKYPLAGRYCTNKQCIEI